MTTTSSSSAGACPYPIVIAASGSGGHLLPAVRIADALRHRAVQHGYHVEIRFIGSGRPLEAELIDTRGYPRQVVALSGLRRRGIRGVFEFLTKLPRAVMTIATSYRKNRPALVIGVGGYVSVLPVIIARLCGIPTWIHEPEHTAGWSNRILARVVSGISLAWADAQIPCRDTKGVLTGHPLDPKFLELDFSKQQPSSPLRVLVLGGSQGATRLDQALQSLAPQCAAKGWEVRHQCRPEHLAQLQECYETHKVSAQVVSFIDDMAHALHWADIVVTRSGAGAVQELLYTGRPAILVPLEGSKEQHDNAKVVVDQGPCGVLLSDADPRQFQIQLLAALEQLANPEYYRRAAAVATQSQLPQGEEEGVATSADSPPSPPHGMRVMAGAADAIAAECQRLFLKS